MRSEARSVRKDAVTPELRRAVLQRDGMCVAAKFLPQHVCRDQWGGALLAGSARARPMTRWSRCVRCGLTGYGIAKITSRGPSLLCRHCWGKPGDDVDRRAYHREDMRRRRERAYQSAQTEAGSWAILGPCRCQHCGTAVWYGHSDNSVRDKLAPIWRDIRGFPHARQGDRIHGATGRRRRSPILRPASLHN